MTCRQSQKQTSIRKSESSSYCSWTTGTSLNFFPSQLVRVHVRSGFCMNTGEDTSLRFFATIHVKDQVLGNALRGIFRSLFDRISHHIHIFRTSCSQPLARSWNFCLLVDVVYWTCGLKFMNPMTNLSFLGIIATVKLASKLCLHRFEWFCLPVSSDTKYFTLLSKTLWSTIDSCYCFLFPNLKQKRHNILLVEL